MVFKNAAAAGIEKIMIAQCGLSLFDDDDMISKEQKSFQLVDIKKLKTTTDV